MLRINKIKSSTSDSFKLVPHLMGHWVWKYDGFCERRRDLFIVAGYCHAVLKSVEIELMVYFDTKLQHFPQQGFLLIRLLGYDNRHIPHTESLGPFSRPFSVQRKLAFCPPPRKCSFPFLNGYCSQGTKPKEVIV